MLHFHAAAILAACRVSTDPSPLPGTAYGVGCAKHDFEFALECLLAPSDTNIRPYQVTTQTYGITDPDEALLINAPHCDRVWSYVEDPSECVDANGLPAAFPSKLNASYYYSYEVCNDLDVYTTPYTRRMASQNSSDFCQCSIAGQGFPDGVHYLPQWLALNPNNTRENIVADSVFSTRQPFCNQYQSNTRWKDTTPGPYWIFTHPTLNPATSAQTCWVSRETCPTFAGFGVPEPVRISVDGVACGARSPQSAQFGEFEYVTDLNPGLAGHANDVNSWDLVRDLSGIPSLSAIAASTGLARVAYNPYTVSMDACSSHCLLSRALRQAQCSHLFLTRTTACSTTFLLGVTLANRSLHERAVTSNA